MFISEIAVNSSLVTKKANCSRFIFLIKNNGPDDATNVTAELWSKGILLDSYNIQEIQKSQGTFVDFEYSTATPLTDHKLQIKVNCQAGQIDNNPDDNVEEFEVSWYYDNTVDPFNFNEDVYNFDNWNITEQTALETCIDILYDFKGAEVAALYYPVIGPILVPFADVEGHCYGMAATSILYKKNTLQLPYGVNCTYELTPLQAKENIELYQRYQIANKISRDVSSIIYDGDDEYQELRDSLEFSGQSMVLGYSKHAVVAYGIIEIKANTTNPLKTQKIILTYDNNFHSSPDYERYEVYSGLGMSIEPPFNGYPVNFENILDKLFKDAINGMLSTSKKLLYLGCPAHMLITDQYGRQSGYFNGQYVENIPGSEVINVGEDEFITVPDNLEYSIIITGTDNGVCDFDIIVPKEDDTVDNFLWHDLPVQNGSTILFDSTLDVPASEAINSLGGTYLPDFISFNPNKITIQNFVKQLQINPNKPDENQGFFTYVEKAGNLNGIDSNDIFYTAPDSNSSKIVSLIPYQNLKGQIIDYNELALDARPFTSDVNVSNSDVLFELSIYCPEPNDPNQTINHNIISENYLKFYLANNAFTGKPLTIQQVSSDSNIEFPVLDIRNIINKNNRKLPLDNIMSSDVDPNVLLDPNCILDPYMPVKIIQPNVPYAWFTLSTSREIADIDNNGIVDKNDRTLLLADLGKEGIFRSDIASFKDGEIILGIPDGKVDEIDDYAFIDEYNKKHPDDPIENPYKPLSEDFESGQIQEPFTTSGDLPWIINTDAYEGDYCAKSGDIGNRDSSILEVNAFCIAGEISFYRKVSSEYSWDELIFYIDDVEQERWSGDMDWEEVNFQTTPGTHNFKWIYEKDRSDSEGEDAAWIDNININ